MNQNLENLDSCVRDDNAISGIMMTPQKVFSILKDTSISMTSSRPHSYKGQNRDSNTRASDCLTSFLNHDNIAIVHFYVAIIFSEISSRPSVTQIVYLDLF